MFNFLTLGLPRRLVLRQLLTLVFMQAARIQAVPLGDFCAMFYSDVLALLISWSKRRNRLLDLVVVHAWRDASGLQEFLHLGSDQLLSLEGC